MRSRTYVHTKTPNINSELNSKVNIQIFTNVKICYNARTHIRMRPKQKFEFCGKSVWKKKIPMPALTDIGTKFNNFQHPQIM